MEFEKDGIKYLSLVNSINGRIKTFNELSTTSTGKEKKDKILLIRHDVDRSIDIALDLAQLEKDAGIRATYFLLPSANYFDYSERLAEKIKILSEMGHEIGLHSNAIADYYRINKPFKCIRHDIGSLYLFSTLKNIFSKSKTIKDILTEPLNFIRELNIEVSGTSPHGDRLCSKIGFNNADLWKKYSLSDFGLVYDTSMLSYDCFLGSRLWQGINLPDNKNYGLGIIDKFNSMSYGVFQLLTHPCNWRKA